MKKIDQLAQEAALNSGLVTLDFSNRPVPIELEFAMDLYKAGFNAAQEQLKKADEIILDIHSQITTFSKYTASRVYDWKDIRGEDGTPFRLCIGREGKEFDDNGRDEDKEDLTSEEN
jgi:hypothetical protein